MAGTANLTIILSAKDSATQALRSLGTAFSDTTQQSTKLRIEFLQAEQRAAALAQRARTTGTELAQLKADQAANQVAQLGREMEATTSRASLMGAALGALGAAAAAAAVAFAAMSVKMAAGFETATVELQNQAQLTKGAAENISNALLDMGRSSEFGGKALVEALTPIAGRLESVTGAALTTSQALQVMGAAGDLAEASNTGLKESTSALINVMLAYQLPLSQAADASDKLFNISRVTGIGLSEMSTAIDRLKDKLGNSAPDLTQMGALLAELSAQGISGSRGLLAVSSAIENLTSGSDKVNTTLHNLGVGVFDASGNFIGLRNVIAELTPVFAKMTEAQQNEAAAALFGAGASGVLVNVIKGGTGAFDTFASRVSASGTAAKAAAADNETMAVQMKILHNDISALTTAFGQQLLPVVEKFTGVLTPITNALADNETAMRAIAIVAGGVLVAGLAAAAIAFYALIPPAVAAAIAMNAAFLFIPVAIAAAVAALYLLVTNWQTVADNVKVIARDLVIYFSPAGPLGLIVAHWQQIFDAMPKPVQDAMNKIAGSVSATVNLIIDVINRITGAWNSLGLAAKVAVVLIFGPVLASIAAVVVAIILLKQHWDTVWNAMIAVGDGVARAIRGIWEADVVILTTLWRTLSTAWNNAWSGMSAIVSAEMTIVQGVITGIGTVINGMVIALQAMRRVWETIGPVVVAVAAIILAPLLSIIATLIVLKNNWDTIWRGMSAVVGTVADAVSNVWTVSAATLAVIWGTLNVIWNAAWSGMSATAEAVATSVVTIWTSAVGYITGTWTALSIAWSNAWSGMQSVVEPIVSFVVSAASRIVGIWNAIAPAITVLAAIIFSPIIIAVGSVVLAVIALKDNWDRIWSSMGAVVNAVANIVRAIWSADVAVITAIWRALSTAWNGIWTVMTVIVRTVASAVRTIWATEVSVLRGIWTALTSAWNAVWIGATSSVNAVVKFVETSWAVGVNTVIGMWRVLATTWQAIWGGTVATVATIVSAVQQLWIAAVGAITGTWATLAAAWDAVWAAMPNAVTSIVGVIAAVWSAAVGVIASIWGTLSAPWFALWNSMSGVVASVVNYVQSIWVTGVNFLLNIWGAIGGAWSSVWDAFPDPVISAMTKVGNIVVSAVQGMIDVINKFLGGLNSIADKLGGIIGTLSGGVLNLDLSVPAIPNVSGFQLSGGGGRRGAIDESLGGAGSGARGQLDRFAAGITGVGNAAIGALPDIQGIVPALTGGGGGGGGGKGGGVAGAASQASKDLIALSAAFQQWHAQTGGDAAAFSEYLDAQKLIGQQTQAVTDTARQGRVELRALAIALGQAGISGEAFVAQTGLRALAAAFQNFGGTVAQFIDTLHGLSQTMLADASSLASKLGKPILSFNTGAEGYVDQYGVRHTGAGNVDPTGFAKLPDWLKDFLRQHPTDTKITTPYGPEDPRNKTSFPGIPAAKPTVNYYGPVTVNTTENASQTLATMAMAVR